ncbi:hypothetical protein LCGC14_3052130 [marine sediment metagenome]|uniref:Uncharacterized protein n=1 Tax=marine sediment metagenome TaxID=412755 RepID=A0A0F8X9K4_9ZZZZ
MTQAQIMLAIIGLLVLLNFAWAFLTRAQSRALDRIRERAERVLEDEHWWLPGDDMEESQSQGAMLLSIETEQAAARWLLKVVNGGSGE